MKPRLDHIGLDVSDYERSKAFYEKALAPLGMRLLMEPVPNVCGFGDDFPFFWIGKRGRGADSGTHVAFTAEDRETVDAFHSAALEAGGRDNGGPGVRADLPPQLLRRLRARPRRQQRRGRLPHPGLAPASCMSSKGENQMLTAVPEVIKSYFHFDALRNIDSLVELFTDDATVVDERVAYHGTADIRAWRTGPASKYTYTTDILGSDALTADRYVVRGRLEGNFPGGTADVAFEFTIGGDRISRLEITPV